jgi:hypothetical protein
MLLIYNRLIFPGFWRLKPLLTALAEASKHTEFKFLYPLLEVVLKRRNTR